MANDYGPLPQRPNSHRGTMSPLTIAIALLLCAFVIAVAYMAVDEHV